MNQEPAQIPQRKRLPRGQLLIDGKWRDASDGITVPTIDPTTEETITEVAKASAEDADAAVSAARSAFEAADWPRLNHEARARILFRVAIWANIA
jgi:aldehyde dehydrogenase (NAD+)